MHLASTLNRDKSLTSLLEIIYRLYHLFLRQQQPFCAVLVPFFGGQIILIASGLSAKHGRRETNQPVF
jgi:hypothetical protein